MNKLNHTGNVDAKKMNWTYSEEKQVDIIFEMLENSKQ